VPIPAGLVSFGSLEGEADWCWDNERPEHKAYLEPFAFADRLVTNREYLEFMADGGYENPLLWLSNGWAQAGAEGWEAPLYWSRDGEGWSQWTLDGDRPVDLDEPVCHVGFYEAEAYARWRSSLGGESTGTRLPTEREWEQAARSASFPGLEPNFLDTLALHPRHAPIAPPGEIVQMGGDVWEWTTSHYEPYPRYRPFEGALMEYNGKFMDNQRVLRGGSCATPANHIRASYRNFWPGGTRFQFTGIRLAREVG
jgi:ergothioneine biosynthesis protein EgtB